MDAAAFGLSPVRLAELIAHRSRVHFTHAWRARVLAHAHGQLLLTV
jgi:hypothetical protein